MRKKASAHSWKSANQCGAGSKDDWRPANALNLNVEPAVGSTPPWAGVTPAPSKRGNFVRPMVSSNGQRPPRVVRSVKKYFGRHGVRFGVRSLTALEWRLS